MADILFRQVRLPNRVTGTFDVAVDGGLIVTVTDRFDGCASTIVDGRGRLLMPGAVDMHVHFREPGATSKEDIASGSRAALLAGVTTVADMPNNTPPVTTADDFLAKADIVGRNAACDMRLYMALTGKNLKEIQEVRTHPLFAGVKVFLGATTGNMLCDLDAVRRAADVLDCLFVFHAESDRVLRQTASDLGPGSSADDHPRLRPTHAAVDAVKEIASVFRPGMRFHICHVSCAEELGVIAATPGITCEAAPHHMALDATDTVRLGNLSKMNPPLRDPSDRRAVLKALREGRIDCVATDHAPHTLSEKDRPYQEAPAGVPGVDTMVPWVLSLVRDGVIDAAAAARLTSGNPAAILGLTDRGSIREGLRADMYLVDLDADWEVRNADIRSKCGWTPFEGMHLVARPDIICLAGKLATEGN